MRAVPLLLVGLTCLCVSAEADIPKWACKLSPLEAKAANEIYFLLPKSLHQTVRPSGNATTDQSVAVAIEKAGKSLEREDRDEALRLAQRANASAAAAQREASEVAALDAKAKVDTAEAASQDMQRATATAEAAVSHSEAAVAYARNASAVSQAGEKEAQDMATAAAGWHKAAEAERKQSVVLVDEPALKRMAAQADLLVVFFTPWCPHCKDFVLQDTSGNPAKAPVELLHKEIQQDGGPRLVKFDAEAHKIPAGFDVKYVPMLYLVKKSGSHVRFEGNPHDFKGVKDFAKQKNNVTLSVLMKGRIVVKHVDRRV